MKYPKLVPDWVQTTSVVLKAQNGENEDGTPFYYITRNLKCNWQNSSSLLYNDERRQHNYRARAYFDGDIQPSGGDISGIVTAYDEDFHIVGYQRSRNPDGSVNYTVLELA